MGRQLVANVVFMVRWGARQNGAHGLEAHGVALVAPMGAGEAAAAAGQPVGPTRGRHRGDHRAMHRAGTRRQEGRTQHGLSIRLQQ